MDKYDPAKRVALVVDEWGTWWDVEPGTNPGFLYQQNTMRDAMVAALSLNYFNDRCDILAGLKRYQRFFCLKADQILDRLNFNLRKVHFGKLSIKALT